ITKVTDTLTGFYKTYYMNTALQASTRFYGRVDFNKKGLIRGIRHTVNPSVTFTYAPDFSKTAAGGWVTVPNDPKENGKSIRYFEYLSNQTPQFKQEVLDFSLSNILEMKVRNRKDTTGSNGSKKINLLDNLSINGGYNFGADFNKMKNVTIAARTKLLNRFDINMTSAFDPYKWLQDSSRVIDGQKVIYNHRRSDTYLFNVDNGQFAQLSTMNLTIGTRFAPKKKPVKKDPAFNNPQMQAELNYIRANPNQYIDFNVPWSLVLSFTYNYTHTGLMDPVINEALAASGDISLTPKWKIVYSTGYNFRDHAITYSNFTISRDLHCWQMNMTLSPFGTLRTFNFMIAAKSQLLQTLKLNKRSPTFIQ
ncbi:MAG TPA: putative LPS assembly protein LptD, partial [Cytophagaceae bacterium]|nr:putative LPS assembly protein LptD [Cytophagaceae bacterium]